MQTAIETTITALVMIVQTVPVGTNISLVRMLWVMVNGSFLGSRGAIHSALDANEFSEAEIRRSWAALRYGSWTIDELLTTWQCHVAATNEWRERRYGGYRVKSVDITGFFRMRLQGKVSQHYNSIAQRALRSPSRRAAPGSGRICFNGCAPEQRDPPRSEAGEHSAR